MYFGNTYIYRNKDLQKVNEKRNDQGIGYLINLSFLQIN